jgi:uncharacterized protein with HEPN domain
MRREELYLRDICEAADSISRFILGLDVVGFKESELIGSAVVQKLAVIGEAAARVSADVRSRHPEIPWAEIIAFRNILVHAYFGIDWSVVWLAASKQVPVLRCQVASVLSAEFDSPVG